MKNNFKLSVLMATLAVGLTTFSVSVNSEPVGVQLNTISSTSKYLEDTDDKRLSPKMIQDILATDDGEAKLRDQFGIQMEWINVSTYGLSDEGKKHILLKQGDPHGPNLFKSQEFLTPKEQEQLRQQIERVERGEEPVPAPEPPAEEVDTRDPPPPSAGKQSQSAPGEGTPSNGASPTGDVEHSDDGDRGDKSTEGKGEEDRKESDELQEQPQVVPVPGSEGEHRAPEGEPGAQGTPGVNSSPSRDQESPKPEQESPNGDEGTADKTASSERVETPKEVVEPHNDATVPEENLEDGAKEEKEEQEGKKKEETTVESEEDHSEESRTQDLGTDARESDNRVTEETEPGVPVTTVDNEEKSPQSPPKTPGSPEHQEGNGELKSDAPQEDGGSSAPKNLDKQNSESEDKTKEGVSEKEQADPKHKATEEETVAKDPENSPENSPEKSSEQPKDADETSAKPTVTPPTVPSVDPQVTTHTPEEIAQASSAVQGSLAYAPAALVGNMHTVASSFFEVAGGNFSSGVSLFVDASTPNTGVVADSSGKDYLGNATSRNELDSGFKVYFDYGYRNHTLKTDVAHSKVKQHNFAVGLYAQDQGINYGFAVVQSSGSTLSTPVIPFRTKLTSTTGTNTNNASNVVTNNAVITASSSSSSSSSSSLTTLTSRTKLNSTGVMGSVGLASANDYLNLGGYVLFSKANNYRSSVGFEDQRSTVSSTQIGLDLTYGYRVYKDNQSSIVLTAGVTDIYYSQGAFTETATSTSAKPQSLSFQSLSKNHLFLHLGAQGTYLARVDNLLFKTDAGIRLEQALTNNRYDFKLQDGTLIKGVAGDTFTAKLVLGETIYVDNFSLRLGVEFATGNKTNARVDKLTATFTYKF